MRSLGKYLSYLIVLLLLCAIFMTGFASAGKVGTTTCPGCARVADRGGTVTVGASVCSSPGCSMGQICQCPGYDSGK